MKKSILQKRIERLEARINKILQKSTTRGLVSKGQDVEVKPEPDVEPIRKKQPKLFIALGDKIYSLDDFDYRISQIENVLADHEIV